jgi:hypothetical protein
VFRWNGTTWTTMITQVVQVSDLWGSADGDVHAAGIFGLSHWAGASWTSSSNATVMNAAGLWGFGAADAWAVGDFATLAHWDGAKWSDAFPAGDASFLDSHASVWGAATNDVWAVGEAGAISHWDGARWTQAQVGAFPYFPSLNKVHGSSAADVWAVGLSTDGKNTGVILHHAP